MSRAKCPRCELNYLKEGEEICSVCWQELNKHSKHRNETTKLMETDLSVLVAGRVYGTNTKLIYEKCCDTLGWASEKKNCFGWQTPLYASNADTDRTRDVWFIFYPNYDANNLDAVVENRHVVNLIEDNDERIVEIVEDRLGASNNADRITFVRTNNGYEFLGVYKIVQNGTTRIYQRISKRYPV